jgi:hypothetical protein
MARRTYPESEAPRLDRLRIGKELAPGEYFLAARIKDDAGQVRYAYAPYTIELTEPAQGRTAAMVAPRSSFGSMFSRDRINGVDEASDDDDVVLPETI